MAENNRTTGLRGGLPPPEAAGLWGPLSGLRREMDRLFDAFGTSRWPVPGAIRLIAEMLPMPAMDLVASYGSYEMRPPAPTASSASNFPSPNKRGRRSRRSRSGGAAS